MTIACSSLRRRFRCIGAAFLLMSLSVVASRPSEGASCEPDSTAAGIVDLIAQIGAPDVTCSADLSGDEVVDADDLDLLLRRVFAAPGAGVDSPLIEGPVSGGHGVPFIGSTQFDLAVVGYSQVEFFISGTAASYRNIVALGANGQWSVEPAARADFKTRILAYRPIDPARFNGTVIVEWLNVSGGVDGAADWIVAHTELIRSGYAWLGVSAQKVGVEGGTSIVGLPSRPLKKEDPERYGSLVHPGDSFSYDIFSQAGQTIRRPNGPRPLGDLHPRKVIAVGESQSAFRLTTYIDALHPRDRMYDGYLVHSRGSYSTAALSETPQPSIPVSAGSIIREDVGVPVLIFETETDLTLLGYVMARQADSNHVRLWEVAGTAHADTYTVAGGGFDLGGNPEFGKITITADAAGISCLVPINSGPQHFVLNAAFAALHAWVVDGTVPPTSPRIEVEGTVPPVIQRDQNGNAIGGVRTPYVDVPIAMLSGEGQVGSVLCLLFGTTVPFDAAKLADLYADHETYVSLYGASTDAAVAAGFILPTDGELMKAAAAETDVP